MSNKQTAVEWLFLKMNVIRLEHDMGMLNDFEFISSQNEVFKKAKEMEKKQIEIAFSKSYLIGLEEVNYDDVNKQAEEYYNANYGKRQND